MHEVVNVNDLPVLEIESVRVDELLCCVIDKGQLWWYLELALKDSDMVSGVVIAIGGPSLALNGKLSDILEAYGRSQEHLKGQAIHPLPHPERDLSQLSHELHGLKVLLSWHLFLQLLTRLFAGFSSLNLSSGLLVIGDMAVILDRLSIEFGPDLIEAC